MGSHKYTEKRLGDAFTIILLLKAIIMVRCTFVLCMYIVAAHASWIAVLVKCKTGYNVSKHWTEWGSELGQNVMFLEGLKGLHQVNDTKAEYFLSKLSYSSWCH